MTTDRVSWFLPEGVRALANFLVILSDAGRAEGAVTTRVIDDETIGFYLHRDGKRCWAGVFWNEPSKLSFSTWEVPVDKAKADALRLNGVQERKKSGHF